MTSILSGGNQQRLIVHREALVAKAAFVAVHPSRGLDVHATQDVQAALLAARDSGCAVLLISDDLDEVLLISDRVAVMYEGRVVGVFDRRHADRERLGLLMGGHTTEDRTIAGGDVMTVADAVDPAGRASRGSAAGAPAERHAAARPRSPGWEACSRRSSWRPWCWHSPDATR